MNFLTIVDDDEKRHSFDAIKKVPANLINPLVAYR